MHKESGNSFWNSGMGVGYDNMIISVREITKMLLRVNLSLIEISTAVVPVV